MGGTSCDVALVHDGAPARTVRTVIAGHPLHLPMLDVATVSAGGGSVAWADSGGALRVGPESAGARPGPAAYGLGGDRPTVTDANVVLGRLPTDAPLGGTIRLDPAAAREAVGAAGRRAWGCPWRTAPLGIVEVAVQEMVRALRLVSVERGEDAREATLIAFGGAGPAARLPRGRRARHDAASSPRPRPGSWRPWAWWWRASAATTCRPCSCGWAAAPRLGPLLSPLAERARAELPGAAHRASADCRYVGQSHSLTIDWDPERPDEELAVAFHAAHRARFGDADPGRPVEAVTLRLAAELPGSPPDLPTGEPGEPVRGPAVIPMEGATCWVGEGWTARTDAVGAIVLERHG